MTEKKSKKDQWPGPLGHEGMAFLVDKLALPIKLLFIAGAGGIVSTVAILTAMIGNGQPMPAELVAVLRGFASGLSWGFMSVCGFVLVVTPAMLEGHAKSVEPLLNVVWYLGWAFSSIGAVLLVSKISIAAHDGLRYLESIAAVSSVAS